MTGVLVKLTGHPVARDWHGDLPRCVMDTIRARFGTGVEVMYSSGYGSNHRPLAAQRYPASQGSPRTANAIARILEDSLPTMDFQPLTKIGTVTGYDQFASHAGSASMNGTDPDRLGAQIQIYGFNDIYLSCVPGEPAAQQGMYVRARTHDTRHMYNGYGNGWFMYYSFGRWDFIGHYENTAKLSGHFESFRMAQEITRGVNIMEDSLRALQLPGDVDGDGHVDVVDLLYFVDAFGSATGDAGYDVRCDFNQDASVDVVDLLMMVENWGM
jgi:hypothetical protein